MPSYHLLNVFTAEDGSYGNPLAVFLAGSEVAHDQRQRVAADLGYSETVFIDDPARGVVRIFTPASELPLAGHPLVGSAWLLARELGSCEMLRPPAGDVPTWQDGDVRWISARPEWAPRMEIRQFQHPDQVEALTGAPDDLGFVDAWAWLDETAGAVRSRVFAADEGIPEDEATGAAALRMGERLGRPIDIHQGAGSLLHARPDGKGRIEVGGRVSYVEEIPYG